MKGRDTRAPLFSALKCWEGNSRNTTQKSLFWNTIFNGFIEAILRGPPLSSVFYGDSQSFLHYQMPNTSHVLPVGYGGESDFSLVFPALHSSTQEFVPGTLRKKRDPNSAWGPGEASPEATWRMNTPTQSLTSLNLIEALTSLCIPYPLATCTIEHLKCV